MFAKRRGCSGTQLRARQELRGLVPLSSEERARERWLTAYRYPLRGRQLRRNASDAEQRLWMRLRRHQIHGVKFRRQEPIGPYVVDFCCLTVKVVIEGRWHAEQIEADARRRSSSNGSDTGCCASGTTRCSPTSTLWWSTLHGKWGDRYQADTR